MSKRVGGFINQDGLNAPNEPTAVSASAGDTAATVSFTAPANVGGSALTGYVATSNDGIGATGSASPITVTGLTNGTSYTFRVWALNAFGYSAPSGASGSITPVVSVLALVTGFSVSSTYTNTISYYNVSTNGNATDFGDLTFAHAMIGTIGGLTRTIFVAGRSSSSNNHDSIEYVNPLSTGNATNFGNLSSGGRQSPACFGNQTRGIAAGGSGVSQGAPNYEYYNTIDYLTIATTGNTSDFGDLTQPTQVAPGFSSPTRGIRSTGRSIDGGGSTIYVNTIDYVTIATTGNATDFGDGTSTRYNAGCCASSTRGLTAGGISGAFVHLNIVDYVTIATTGNATDFGDLVSAIGAGTRGASSETRGTFFEGESGNSICVVTIASTGNAVDFGDLNGVGSGNQSLSANTNGHGGLQ
jgi:hypothetical protein